MNGIIAMMETLFLKKYNVALCDNIIITNQYKKKTT